MKGKKEKNKKGGENSNVEKPAMHWKSKTLLGYPFCEGNSGKRGRAVKKKGWNTDAQREEDVNSKKSWAKNTASRVRTQHPHLARYEWEKGSQARWVLGRVNCG